MTMLFCKHKTYHKDLVQCRNWQNKTSQIADHKVIQVHPSKYSKYQKRCTNAIGWRKHKVWLRDLKDSKWLKVKVKRTKINHKPISDLKKKEKGLNKTIQHLARVRGAFEESFYVIKPLTMKDSTIKPARRLHSETEKTNESTTAKDAH